MLLGRFGFPGVWWKGWVGWEHSTLSACFSAIDCKVVTKVQASMRLRFRLGGRGEVG